eukprot:CAMPEP_0198694754 /NCGR_PEP_ID=MMETSP1468-20131203/275771_1 /TAXON_ID=1461545 /ORGANISM="Mantoniella sp, Strain CCMP1436" /LENGTH=65 /DNA_ID=CAMNT_0044450129 /DNA_START=105 /DNA_END=298 /DNA_ORIENTATION=+
MEGLKALLEAGTNPNKTLADGKTALGVAAAECRVTMVSMLLEAGAKMDTASGGSLTPLMIAVCLG